ncbi:type II toxin-antitoxin system HigB family toxin [Dyadobacter fanqingshengii]|uniref:Type II toxin-antitoxin system HigB family toxin n=1 Tax=Dyadobacter fanqingshengii TaxID=2906443 RepID=A0A9X1PA52_9BACT|nr:type II toxin-antitoxin system HigB family toxin [Dyadobacter fanqingshengii]MCF0040810.1 type II toxin-antitoxin system HigB family toxin [Dyadobacter fanqingshengii]USJ37455.1 type II toxin-antitoxin system HigB family toxin [Dyadobacter fanqingshengii]
MRIVAKGTLKEFWETHTDAKTGLLSWYEKMNSHDYSTPQEVIADFKGADYVGNERVVFNIARNKYRLIVSFNYQFKACWIKFVGTHKDYDRIDAKTIEHI